MLADARPVRILVNMVRTESTDFSMRSSASSAMSSTVNSSLSLTGGGAMKNDDGADGLDVIVLVAAVGTPARGVKARTYECVCATNSRQRRLEDGSKSLIFSFFFAILSICSCSQDDR
jgi:hypothetical protein